MPCRAGPAAVLVLVLCGVAGGRALDVRVHGDVLFGLQLSEAAARRVARAQPLSAHKRAAPHSPSAPAPAAPAPACRYHYPEQEQVDAILSNMMNELTKVFVRANLFLKSEDTTRHSAVWRAEEEKEGSSTTTSPLPESPSLRRSAATVPTARGSAATVPSSRESAAAMPSTSPSPPPSPSPSPSSSSPPLPPTPPPGNMFTAAAHSNRFKVVNSKNTQFFEHIFHNMTEEFSSVYNGSAHVSRARGDPCRQQGAVRRAWRDLLRRSLAAFRRAALNCVQDYLKIQECEERTKARLVRFLVRELGKMRTRHLQLLCDRFQLCLDEDQRATTSRDNSTYLSHSLVN